MSSSAADAEIDARLHIGSGRVPIGPRIPPATIIVSVTGTAIVIAMPVSGLVNPSSIPVPVVPMAILLDYNHFLCVSELDVRLGQADARTDRRKRIGTRAEKAEAESA